VEIDYCNAQWAEFTGIDCNEMRDWGWTQVIHPDDVDETVRHWQDSITTGQPFQFEHRFRRADGGYRWHLTRAHAMRDAHGAVLMWVGSHTDIDDHKRRESTLARSIRQRDEFLSAISHDLKTPLTVLRGQAQILKRRLTRPVLDQGAMLRGLEQIESRSRTMAKLVDELLDVTRLRAGEELHLDRELVDLVALVQIMVREQHEATDNHRLIVRSAVDTLTGWWDRVHLQRVVENLVSNGINIVFALTYALLAQKRSLAVSLSGAFAVWIALSWLTGLVPWTLPAAIVFNVVVLVLALWLSASLRHVRSPQVKARWHDLVMRAAMVALLVGIVVTLSYHIGPTASGNLAVFPIVLTSIILILHRRVGGPATAAVMANAVIGLGGFGVACTTLNLTADHLGAALALGLTLAVSVGCNLLVFLVRHRLVPA